ncbi:unnamed protein product [Symbiodinium sp. CCMP2592]|nr:unnamed protein product [Symbiodinium sp. CCMP2592]
MKLKVPGDLAEHVWSTCSSVASETKRHSCSGNKLNLPTGPRPVGGIVAQSKMSCSDVCRYPSHHMAGWNKLVAGWPLPIVEASGVLSELQMTSLVDLADENDLWRPSARRGGAALEGSPWTALLSSPEHRDHPTARALRQWTAELFKAPMENVEAVRLIRYRQGEGALAAHADARPDGDTSLWLSGQRLATVMLQLGALPDGAGGDLLFPLLEEGGGKQVALQPGSALVWPTIDRDGHPEKRAARQALPLQLDATKYVAMTLGLGCALDLRQVSQGVCPDEALEKSVKDVSPNAAQGYEDVVRHLPKLDAALKDSPSATLEDLYSALACCSRCDEPCRFEGVGPPPSRVYCTTSCTMDFLDCFQEALRNMSTCKTERRSNPHSLYRWV